MTGSSLLSDSLGTTNGAPQVGRASAAENWRVVDGDHAVVQSEIRQGAAGAYLRVSGAAGGRLVRALESAETGPLRLVVKARVRTGALGVSAVRGSSAGPAIVLGPGPDVAVYAVDVPGPADQVVIAVLADGTTADVHDISLQAAGVDGSPATNGQGQEMQAGATPDIAPADESTNGDATELPPVDVFRLMALRAPSSPTGTAPSIALEPPDPGEGEPSSRYVDEQGVLQDFAVYQGPDNVYLRMGVLDAQLATRDDTWAPSDLEEWVQTTSAQSLSVFTAAAEWPDYRTAVHSQLQTAFGEQGDLRLGQVRRPAGLLRLTRLIAVLEGITAETPLTDAAGVHQILQDAEVILSAATATLPIDRLSRPPVIADLKVVRLGPPRYELGAIAQIENVMASEEREHRQRVLQQNETTTVLQTETTTEQERDLQTTSQVQLLQEASNVVQNASTQTAGLTVTASYGPTVSATLDGRLTRSTSQQESSHTAATYSNQVTQQARQKVVERITQTVTTRQLLEIEDRERHAFSNTGADAEHIVGIYRNVEQVQDAWIEDYGRRLMLEFLLPDPAAMVRWAQGQVATALPAGLGPEPQVPTSPQDPSRPLQAGDITVDNYRALVSAVDAQGVTPPPPDAVDIAVSWHGDPSVSPMIFEDHSTMKVPDGYHAGEWVAQGVMWGQSGQPDESWMVGVGDDAPPSEAPRGPLAKKLNGTVDAGSGSTIPVIMLARGFINIAASVRVTCHLTETSLEKWQLDVFTRIMQAYDQAHADWASAAQRAAADAQTQDALAPVDPEVHRFWERRELRRLVIEELLGLPADQGDYGRSAVDYTGDGGRPMIDQDVAAKERDGILFLEQAFEWENLVWLHYPYYWAANTDAQPLWREAITQHGDDPDWDAFLSAGATRAVAPVRPGFEPALSLYLATGVIWAGGEVPTIGDPTYLGIAEELAESTGALSIPGTRVDLEPVRLPTNLIYLQATADLNPA